MELVYRGGNTDPVFQKKEVIIELGTNGDRSVFEGCCANGEKVFQNKFLGGPRIVYESAKYC